MYVRVKRRKLEADFHAQLGYSALVGLGVMIVGFPLQGFLVKVMFSQRKKGVVFTDKRVRLTTEVC